MRRSKPFNDQPWWLISVTPAMEASSRRWNRVIIWSLAFVVASVFAMTLTPQPGHAAFREHKVSLQIDRNPLGVSVQTVSPDMAKAFGLGQGGGALVAEVTPGSPAAKAGIKRGDVILEMNGQPVNEPDDLSVRVAETPPGTTVHLKISRGGEMHEVGVTLGELSERNEASTSAAGAGAALQGVQVRSLTPSIARELGISADVSGVVITSVDPSSPAAAAGLERGDVVQEVNRKVVRSAEEYNKTLAETRGKVVLLLVNRGGSTHFVIVEPQ